MNSEAKEKHLKPYDFKLGGVDNDDAKIEKIYTKHLEYIVYRTDRSIRVDFDDESKNISTHVNNHYKIGVDLGCVLN